MVKVEGTDQISSAASIAPQPVVGFFPRSVETSYVRHRSPEPAVSVRSPGSITTGMSGFSSDDEEWGGSVVGKNLLSEAGDERSKNGGKKRRAEQEGRSASKRRGSVSSDGSIKTLSSLPSDVPARFFGKLAQRSPSREADGQAEGNIDAFTSSLAVPPTHTISSPVRKSGYAGNVPNARKLNDISPTDLHQEVTALQQHLQAFAQHLAAPPALITAYPETTKDRQLAELRQTITNLENRNRTLHHANERLRNKNTELESSYSSMADEMARLADEQELNAGTNERSRTCIGIDPSLIRDLAAALSTGDRKKAAIASELFTLAESATPYAGIEDVRRESFAPRERLRNVEGVLDVTLARMEMMENKMKDMSNSARLTALEGWGGGAIKKDIMMLSSMGEEPGSSKEWSSWEGTENGKSSVVGRA